MYGKCVQTKLILIGQIVKLVGKWPMVDCYFVLCIVIIIMGSNLQIITLVCSFELLDVNNYQLPSCFVTRVLANNVVHCMSNIISWLHDIFIGEQRRRFVPLESLALLG